MVLRHKFQMNDKWDEQKLISTSKANNEKKKNCTKRVTIRRRDFLWEVSHCGSRDSKILFLCCMHCRFFFSLLLFFPLTKYRETLKKLYLLARVSKINIDLKCNYSIEGNDNEFC